MAIPCRAKVLAVLGLALSAIKIYNNGMSSSDTRIISADTPAVVVPSGEPIVIPANTTVQITHRLGGNLTITWEYGMARVSGQYAMNLGETAAEAPKKKKEKREEGAAPDESELWEALKNVFDPEIPVNVVDLGLIYSMEISPLPADPNKFARTAEKNYKVMVKMTLTAVGCGMGPSIAADVRDRILNVEGIADAQVDIVWDPPWNQGMISEAGRMALGLI